MNDEIDDAIWQVLKDLAREKGFSMEDLESVLATNNRDRAKEDYMCRYVKVLRREMSIRNLSEQELAARVGLADKQIFDGESVVAPETVALLNFRIPLALGIDPVDFAGLLRKESSH